MSQGTPVQKCIMALQQKAALMGKNLSTEEATRQCSKKFSTNKNKVKK